MLNAETKLKICGITNLGDARFVSGMLVDYMGFIFFDESPRFIQPAEAGAIINWVEGAEMVGVFVNQPLDEVNQIAKETGLHYVQLHGNESPQYCQLIEKPIIKVIHVEPDSTVRSLQSEINRYEDDVEFFLFDNKTENIWGGTGKSFDWNLLKGLQIETPYFLSGGINAENIRNAVNECTPYAIDVSSSLEEQPGLKDFRKIEAFIEEFNKLSSER